MVQNRQAVVRCGSGQKSTAFNFRPPHSSSSQHGSMLLINQLIALCLRLTGRKQYCCGGSYGNCQLSTVLGTLASTRLIRISNAGAFTGCRGAVWCHFQFHPYPANFNRVWKMAESCIYFQENYYYYIWVPRFCKLSRDRFNFKIFEASHIYVSVLEPCSTQCLNSTKHQSFREMQR